MWGYIEWKQAFDSLDFYFVQQTSDHGYITCGSRFWGEKRSSFFIKFDELGNIGWKKRLTIGDRHGAGTIKETLDGGYIACGNTQFTQAGKIRPWIMKMSSQGKIEWQKKLEGDLDYAVYDLAITSDGGFVLVGSTDVFNLDDTNKDAWAMKLDASGEVIWQNLYSGAESDRIRSVAEVQEGGYILAGYTISNSCWDFLVLRLNADGDISWKRAIGNRQEGVKHLNEKGSAVCQTVDGGFIVMGDTNNLGFVPDTTGNYLHTHVLAVKLAGDNDFYACKFNRDPHIEALPALFRLKKLNFSLKGFGIEVGDIEILVSDLVLNTNDVCLWNGETGNGEVGQKGKKGSVRK